MTKRIPGGIPLDLYRFEDPVPSAQFSLGSRPAGTPYVISTRGKVDRIRFREPFDATVRTDELPATLVWRPGRRREWKYTIIVHDFTDEGVILQDDLPGTARARLDFYRIAPNPVR